MSIGLRNSTIETFRKRFHPGLTLRLLALAADGQSLQGLISIARGFFVSPSPDTQEGAPSHLLTIDQRFTPALNESQVKFAYMIELVNATLDKQRRYRVDTDTLPQLDEDRYVLGLHGAFNDTRPVAGVYTPDTGDSELVAYRYTHTQTIASMLWTVNHNLGERVLAQVLDTNNQVLFSPNIVHVSLNQLTVEFDTPVAGSVRVL